jgi:hypothetical protein
MPGKHKRKHYKTRQSASTPQEKMEVRVLEECALI